MSQARTVPPALYYPAAPFWAPCPPRWPRSPRRPAASTAALWSRATTPPCAALTRDPPSPSATENSPSPWTPPGYRRFRNPTKRRCPCARSRNGAGTPRPTHQHRYRPGRPPDHDVLPGCPFQPQRVDEHVEEGGRQGQHRGQQVDHEPQLEEGRHLQRDGEYQRVGW